MSVLSDFIENTSILPHLSIQCSISLTDKVLVTLSEQDIVSNSFKVSKDGLSSDCFSIGGAVISKLEFILNSYGYAKLHNAGLDVRSTCMKCIETYSGTSDTVIPIGVFYIDTIESKPANCKVVGYDGLTALDIPIDEQDIVALTAPYSLSDRLNQIASRCFVGAYSTTVSKDIIWDTPDSSDTTQTTQFSNNDLKNVKSYRDVLKFVSALYCGIAYMTPDGKLSLKRIGYQNKALPTTLKVKALGSKTDVSTSYQTAIVGYLEDVAGFKITVPNVTNVTPPMGIIRSPSENLLLRGCQPPAKEGETYNPDSRITSWVNFISSCLTGTTFTGGNVLTKCHPDIELGDVLSFSYNTIVYDALGNPSWGTRVVNDFYVNKIEFEHGKPTKFTCLDYRDTSSKDNKGSSAVSSSSSSTNAKAVNSVLSTHNRNAVSGSSTTETEIVTIRPLLDKGMTTQVSVNVVVEVSGDAGEYKGSLKPHLYVDAVETSFHAEYLAFAGKTTISYNASIPSYGDSSVHIVTLSLEATSGVKWSVEAKQAVLIVNASNVQDEYGRYVGTHVFSENIKGIDYKFSNVPCGVQDTLGTKQVALNEGGQYVGTRVFNENIGGIDYKFSNVPCGVQDSIGTKQD